MTNEVPIRQHVGKFLAHEVVDFLAGAHHDREGVAAFERLAGVDDDAGVARIVVRVSHRVERGRPAAAQGLHALARIEPRAHRPDHLVHVGWIDVVVDHDDEAVGVGAGVALRGDQPRLFGVAGILLLDRDGEPQPAAAGRMRPHAFHLGHARSFELIPHRAGPVGAAIERIVVGRDARNGAEQDRIVAVHEGFDADHRLLLQAAGVIAGPFAERAFVAQVVRMNEAFEGDLGMRRNRQPGARPGDHLDRLADQPAGHVVLVLAVGDFEAGNHELRRMHAAHHRDRAWLAALVIAALDDVAMLALGEHHGRDVAARAPAPDRRRN